MKQYGYGIYYCRRCRWHYEIPLSVTVENQKSKWHGKQLCSGCAVAAGDRRERARVADEVKA